MKQLHIETKVVHGCKSFDPHTGSISFPIYQSATFRHPGLNQSTGYDYSRETNPTREELEKTLARLENGKAGFAFSSGMAAIATITELFSPGDHIVVSDDLYGGTYRLFEEICQRHGLEFTYIDTSNLGNLNASLKKNTRALFIETPSNPMMKVTDIQELVRIAKSLDLITIVDNTFLTPYFQRPLELGADIVVHSGTKYLGGHNDVLSGFIVIKDGTFEEKLKLIQKSIGAVLSPFDSWLVLRGMKTLGLRLEKQQHNAIRIANWLKGHPLVEKVYYVGLPEHEGFAISQKQCAGFGGMISFTIKKAEFVEKILRDVKIIAFAESLGGVESLITYPMVQTHGSIPQEIRERLGVNEKLLRLSVGIEAVQDLIDDLDQAMR
ncbi:trans-sulfuration enzyme family protein [Candidatus Formimonas warabiya]|uniref:Cystathionine gamma-synthase n=1 Tax=Formimonas warabiya TaxID=1761012 RepID=A0A3G1KZN9_FORW1|nr:PLP-dependent aspartate aminotransferase family protein [Candidatus Formimonas warabiya]ATW28006.1 cystathionine gamma-synthase [Candidatus Formimonas warabiya]